MSDYTKKKQLLEENKDMFISDYDKSLSYEALNRIIEAKKDFISAAKDNNKTEMTKANDVANAVRAKYGNYTGGDDGSQYHPFTFDDEFEDYTSNYEDELDRLYDLVTKGESEFNYNYEDDPVYKAYKKVYETQGNLAYDRALGENSLKTGGVANTNAQSAAMQALGYYNLQLASKIPELYEAAYEKYYTDKKDDLKRLMDSYDIIKDREERDYKRYIDKIENQKDNRDFVYKQKSDITDNLLEYEKLSDDDGEKMYEILRDAMEDEMWRYKYNLDAYKKGYPSYKGSIGTGDILSYAKKLFGNNSLTLEDLYNLLGL